MQTTIEELNATIKQMQSNIDLLSKSNEDLTARHHALFECVAFMLSHPEKVNAAPLLFATVVYDKVNEALESIEVSDNYKTALLGETDEFFSRIDAHKKYG